MSLQQKKISRSLLRDVVEKSFGGLTFLVFILQVLRASVQRLVVRASLDLRPGLVEALTRLSANIFFVFVVVVVKCCERWQEKVGKKTSEDMKKEQGDEKTRDE